MKDSYDTMPGYMAYEDIDPVTLRQAALAVADVVPRGEVRVMLDALGIEVYR